MRPPNTPGWYAEAGTWSITNTSSAPLFLWVSGIGDNTTNTVAPGATAYYDPTNSPSGGIATFGDGNSGANNTFGETVQVSGLSGGPPLATVIVSARADADDGDTSHPGGQCHIIAQIVRSDT
jgi:hypothetical protein